MLSKSAVLYLSIGAIALYILGLILFIVGAGQSSTGTVLLGLIPFIIAGVLTFLSWLVGLIRTVRAQAWGWFAVILLFSPVSGLIYGIMAPAEHPARVSA